MGSRTYPVTQLPRHNPHCFYSQCPKCRNTQICPHIPTAEPTPNHYRFNHPHNRNQKRWIQTLLSDRTEQRYKMVGHRSCIVGQVMHGGIWVILRGRFPIGLPHWKAIDDVDLLRTVANSYIQSGRMDASTPDN